MPSKSELRSQPPLGWDPGENSNLVSLSFLICKVSYFEDFPPDFFKNFKGTEKLKE